jgi:hypothetical protein
MAGEQTFEPLVHFSKYAKESGPWLLPIGPLSGTRRPTSYSTSLKRPCGPLALALDLLGKTDHSDSSRERNSHKKKLLAALEVRFGIPLRNLLCNPGQEIDRDKVMHIEAGKTVFGEDRMKARTNPLFILDHVHQFGNSRLRKMGYFGKVTVHLSTAVLEEQANIGSAAMKSFERLVIELM